jgi:hypothetical protein
VSDNLTDAAESRVLNWITGNAGATAPTLPLKMRVMTANGSDSAAGTEATGGSYAPYPSRSTRHRVAPPSRSRPTPFRRHAGRHRRRRRGVGFGRHPVPVDVRRLNANKTTGAGDDLKIATTDFSLSMA